MKDAGLFYASMQSVSDEPIDRKKQQREMIERLMASYSGPITEIKVDAAGMIEHANYNSPVAKMRRFQKKQREEKQL